MYNDKSIPRPQHTVFEQIREGMMVHDRENKHIGHVEYVYFGADAGSAQPYSAGAATSRDPSVVDDNIVTDVAKALFGDDDLPETFRNRLRNDGFIRLDAAGLFSRDRYVMRDQIAHVSGDTVHLNVTKDELIAR